MNERLDWKEIKKQATRRNSPQGLTYGTKWRGIQAQQITDVIENNQVNQQEYQKGLIYGTIFFPKKNNRGRGIVMMAGMSGGRKCFLELGGRLAEYGYFCLCIDHPQHDQNPNAFTLGMVSETITAAVQTLRTEFNINHVAVVAHSSGAACSLFSAAGYNREVENDIYRLWENLRKSCDLEGKDGKITWETVIAHKQAEESFQKIKQLIYAAAISVIKNKSSPNSLVLLAPPRDIKAAIPGIGLLQKLRQKTIKKIIETVMHGPVVAQIYKEGNTVSYVPENDPNKVYWQFLKVSNMPEFLEYIKTMKEPMDYIQLLEIMSTIKKNDASTSFIKYYLEKYIRPIPKLFVYGTNDLYLKPFMWGQTKRIEDFYKACGNAVILRTNLSHLLMDKATAQAGIIALQNKELNREIIEFLDSTM